MKRIIINSLLTIMVLAGSLVGAAAAGVGSVAYAAGPAKPAAPTNFFAATASNDAACSGLAEVGGDKCASQDSAVFSTIRKIISILSIIIGIAAVVMILISGFRFITSGGNPESAASAKNGIIYAVIGLIIAALAQAIVAFVLDRAT